MESLIIKHKVFKVLRRVIAVVMIINGVVWILGHIGEMKFLHWFMGISFTGLGIAYYVSAFGSDKSYIEPGEGMMKIRWMNWLRPVFIKHSDIIKMELTKFEVKIERKGLKPVKMNIDFFERNQKKEVYDYVIEYCTKNDLSLERSF